MGRLGDTTIYGDLFIGGDAIINGDKVIDSKDTNLIFKVDSGKLQYSTDEGVSWSDV
jgi:hypothetical protein